MIALGTLIKFTEVAYMARKRKGWYIPVKGNFTVPELLSGEDQDEENRILLSTQEEGRWLHEVNQRTNKAVIAFSGRGSGVVIGFETKMYGHSESSSGGRGMFEDDFEPGYFDPQGKINLYVVRSELRGKPFYVPEESIDVLTLAERLPD